jgi:methyl-accepting chemotaxis protein
MRTTIKMKLGLTFAIIIALSAVTAVLGVSSLSSLDSNLQSLLQGPVERQRSHWNSTTPCSRWSVPKRT